MDGNSLNILSEKITQLKELFPEIFTENQIDFNKFKEILGEDIIVKNEYYQLSWAGKSQARANIYKTTTQTLKPCYPLNPLDNPNTHTLIKGENLEVLRILQKSYFNKIKMIYIDPPYNTGNDCFTYPDDFAEYKKDYLERTGLDDVSSVWKKNTRENGHFHSNWLSMMLPRLSIARGLLRDDGVIFISIDDNEISNLKLLCDEVFGEENFITIICHKSRASVSNDKIISQNHNHILLYAKNQQIIFKNRKNFGLNPDLEGFYLEDKKGKYKLVPVSAPGGSKKGNPYFEFLGVLGYYRFSKDTMQQMYDSGLIVKSGETLQQKYYLEKATQSRKTDTTWWDNNFYTSTATSRLNSFLGGDFFTNPKPIELLKKMLELINDKQALILDFFAGSGTTAQAVMELNEEDGGNRKFICVQLEEKVEAKSEAYKAGYKNISEITEARINKVIEKIKKQREGKIEFSNKPLPKCQVYKLGKSNFKSWCNDMEDIQQIRENLFDFQDSQLSPTTGNEENMLIELCLKRGLGFNITYTKEGDFYKVNTSEGQLWFCFAPYQSEYKTMILEQLPKEVYMLNSSFENDIALTNLKIYLKSEDINLILI